MAKKAPKGQSGISLSTVLIGVGGILGGYALYKLLSSGAAPASPALLPPPSGPIPNNNPPVATLERGPKYQSWVDTINSWHESWLSGTWNAATLNSHLQEAEGPINQDYLNGLLTSKDVDDLRSDRSFYYINV